jgi:CRP/FNR family transcriptional regulator, cyclic AMP receptor protein
LPQRTKLWYLKNINLFHSMSEEQMRMIEQRTVMREVRRREVLYLPGDAGDRIFLLKRGVVKISALGEDGREIILALLRKGEVFGEEAALEDAPRDHLAEAYEDALICIITKQDFLDMLRTYPDLAFRVTKLVGFRLKTFRSRVEKLLFKGAPARLAATLLDLARDHGVPDAQGILLPLKLSQQDLASLIGVTRESVNLALSDFRKKGLVAVEGRTIRLPRPEALQAIEQTAASGPPPPAPTLRATP